MKNLRAIIILATLVLSGCATQSPDKSIETKLRLNDIWAVEKIQGEAIRLKNKQPRPYMEINLHKMQVMGTDGCNNFFGGISVLDSEKMTFGPLAFTRKLCRNMNISDQFNMQMNKVHRYVLEGLILRLFDEKGNELLVFRKVD